MTVLAALTDLYDRLAARGEVAVPGYAPAKIGFEVILSADGTVRDIADIRAMSGKQPRPREIVVPALDGARTSGIRPMFLWDKTAYALGIVNIAAKGEPATPGPAKRTAEEHAAFVAFHKKMLAGTDDPGLRAFLAFLDRWRPEMFAERPFKTDALDQNVVFSLAGEHEYLHDRPEAKRLWTAANAGSQDTGMCLVTGETAPVARLHPMLRGVPGAQSSGAALVSFNLTAFTSYGQSDGHNAPVSTHAAFAYTTALNWLMSNQQVRMGDRNRPVEVDDKTTLSGRRRMLVADTVVVFWADASQVGEDNAERAEDWIADWLDPQDTDDDNLDTVEAERIRAALGDIADGRAVDTVAPDIDPNTRMYVLGLAPNAARLSVRFWLVDSFGNLARYILRHTEDLRLEPPAWRTRPPSWQLVAETALQGKAANVSPRLGGELMRTILTGQPYPRTLLSGVVQRIRADGHISGRRAAICKAVVNRSLGEDQKQRRCPVGLDRDSDDVAYNLGRLFAVYAYAESSFAARGATLRDKYAGAASATPRRVFPILMRGYEHNRSSLIKSDGPKRGSGIKADREVREIIGRFDGSMPLPDTLKLEDQARFFIGFYHQHEALFQKKAQDADETADTDSPDEE